MAVLGATGAVGSEFLDQLVESKKLLTDPSVAGKRKAVSELNIDFKVSPNPSPNPDPTRTLNLNLTLTLSPTQTLALPPTLAL